MDVIILAGGASSDDALAELTGGKLTSMLEIAGKPMVQWVLDAVDNAPSVGTVVLIGIEDVSGLTCRKHLITLPDRGSLIDNIQQGAKTLQDLHPEDTHVVSISADVPAITADIVEAMIKQFSAREVDIYYSVVEREVIETRYPGSHRTFIKVKDAQVCGGDLNCFSKRAALDPNAIWKDLISLRKSPLRQAAMIGLDTLLLILMRQLTLDQAVNKVCKRLGITGRALRVPFAEIGMDVDKPFQFEMVQADLLR
jgi:molybdopterin-guanine dinucleotide biosynthesis protein A